jgi:outer membrane protein, adhesin transport system
VIKNTVRMSLTSAALAVTCLLAQAAEDAMVDSLDKAGALVDDSSVGTPVSPANAGAATEKANDPMPAYASAASSSTQAPVADSGSLAAAVQKAISTNPEVTAALNAFRASKNAVDVASGGFLPQVNLSGDIGKGNNSIRGRLPTEKISSSQQGLRLGVNQLLWDGLATSSEVSRLDHAQMARYFEFVSKSEDVSLEAAKQHIDVLRYRKLVELAEDNYVQHKYAFDQLASKVRAGVGRGVDSEQANARLALAESNLSTEVANLHDVSARYMRVIGEAPTAQLSSPLSTLEKGIVASNVDVVAKAVTRNASISAAVENLRSAEQEAEIRDSAFHPTIEARASTAIGRNLDSVAGQRRDNQAQVVMNWNLFNGGSDRARVRQYADLVNQAADQRDLVCREVRQQSAVAHNDIAKLKDKLVTLDRNVLSIEKARDAYRQQFAIGQRSLLDLLNAENELYTAKRAYADAEYDLMFAYARTHATTNTLVSTLGLARSVDGGEKEKNWQANNEAAQRCPVTALNVAVTSKEELDARARQLGPVAPPPAPVKPEPVADVPTIEQCLRDWEAAWESKNIPRYMTFYAKEFSPSLTSWTKWTSERRRLVGKKGPISLDISNVVSTQQGNYVVTTFRQKYDSIDYKDVTQKTLTWRMLDNGQCIIFKESNR